MPDVLPLNFKHQLLSQGAVRACYGEIEHGKESVSIYNGQLCRVTVESNAVRSAVDLVLLL